MRVLLVLALAVGLVPAQLPAAASASTGVGEFRVSNYASGFQTNNFIWRGYAFRVARQTTVTHLVGGGGPNCTSAGFAGGLFRASLNGGYPRLDSLLAGVTWNPARVHNNQEQVVQLSSPLVLQPGVDYVMAQGRASSTNNSMCHYAADSINVQDLLVGSPIIDQWYPNVDAAFQFGSYTGTPAGAVGTSATGTTPVRVLMGFRYETNVEPATFDPQAEQDLGTPRGTGSSTARLEGRLVDSGAPEGGSDETALYFQFSQSPGLNPSRLVQAGTIEGPADDDGHTFFAEVDGLIPGTTYYYRSVAVNESGRSEGPIRSFVFQGAETATIATQPAATVAGATLAGPPTVRLATQAGTPLAGREVTVEVLDGTLAAGTTTVTTDADGRAVFDDLVVERAGTGLRLRFTTDGIDASTSNPFSVSAAVVDPASTTIAVSAEQVEAGGHVTVTAQLRDRYGNPSGDSSLPLTLSTDLGQFGNGATTIGRDGLTETTPGTFTTTLTLPRAGTATITGSDTDVSVTVAVAARTPGAPTQVAGVKGDRQVTLSWDAPSDDGGSATTGYRIEQSTDGGDTWTVAIADTGTSDTTATIDGLDNGTAYTFRVTAINIAGAGDHSSASPSVTPLTSPTAADVSVTYGDGSIRLEVTAPADDGGTPVTGYEYSLDGGDTWLPLPGAPGTVTIDELVNGVTYEVTVRAVNAEGPGASAPVVSVTPLTSPAAADLSAAHGDRSIRLEVTAPADDGGTPVTGYEYSLDGGQTWLPLPGAPGTVTIDELVNGVTYEVTVRAVNAEGPGAATPVVTVTPLAPPAAADVTVTHGSRSITIVVAAPADDGGTPVTGYEYSLDGGQTWLPLPGAPGTVTIDHLRNGVTYDVSVRPVNAEGPGSATPVESVEPTPAPEPEQAPTPGTPVIVVDGQPVTGTRTVERGHTIRLATGDLAVRITGRDREGAPLRVDAAGRLVVRKGGSVVVSGEGFAADTDVDVWLFSDPTFLGQVAVDADGAFAGVLPLPNGITPGEHVAQLNGIADDGRMVSVSVTVLVLPDHSADSAAVLCGLPLDEYPDFDDIANSHHERNVRCMAAYGLTNGIRGGNSYAPSAPVTRGQMASFVARWLERASGETLPSTRTFDDIAGNDHAANIAKLATIGVVVGVGDGDSYDPQAPVSRAQMGSFVRRGLSWLDDGDARNATAPSAPGEALFPDIGFDGPHGANVQALAEAGIVLGHDDGRYRPDAAVSRGQMASYVMRAYGWAHHELGAIR